jgi:O-antigen/teichoic acid export membrane protein
VPAISARRAEQPIDYAHMPDQRPPSESPDQSPRPGPSARPPARPPRNEAGPDGSGPAGSPPVAGEHRSQLNLLARNSTVKLLGGLVNGLFGFALIVIVARSLHSGGSGAFFEGIALYSLAISLALLGADAGLVRMIPRLRAMGRTQDLRPMIKVALIPVAAIGAIIAAALFVTAPALARAISHHPGAAREVTTYIRVLVPFIPLGAVSTVALGGTRGFATLIPPMMVDNFGKPALRPVLMISVLAAGLGAVAIGLAWALPIVAGLVVGLLWLRVLLRRAEGNNADDRGPARSPRSLAGEFWRFSAPTALAGVSQRAILWLDTLLIGGLATTADAGVYTATTRYLLPGLALSQALNAAISPQISALVTKGSLHEAQTIYRTSTAWLVAISWPIYLVLAAWAPLVLRILGKDFAAGQGPMMILAGAVMFSLAAGPVSTVLLMSGHAMVNLVNVVAALVVNIALNLILIPRMGINGAAIAWATSIVLGNAAALVEVWAFERLLPFGKRFLVVAPVSALCFGGLGVLFRATLGMRVPVFLLYGVLASGLYIIFLWRARSFLRFAVLRNVLRKRSLRAAVHEARVPSPV